MKYGVIIDNPKSNGASDEVVLRIPDNEVKARISIGGQITTKQVSGGGVVVNPISSSAVALAEEISSIEGYNVIVIGGPAVNPLAKELFGVDREDFTPNEAMIRIVDNGGKVAMLVAGYSAVDTLNAAEAIVAKKLKDVKQTELKVISTTQERGKYTVETGGSPAS